MTKASRGVSLVELMVAVAVLSLAVVGLMAAFVNIQKSIQVSKAGTLGSTLAQEQMQILQQKVYYQILITTNPSYDTNFTPSVEYDPGYFPPQSVLEGGVNYIRYTMVEVAKEDSGTIVIMSPSTPDTGMKLVTVTVAWKNGYEWKNQVLRTIVSNPDTVMSNAIFSGLVRNASTAAAIPNAVVNVSENLGWRDTTNASGIYSIGLSPGSYTLGTVVPGYFPAHRSVSIAANQSQTQDFDLTPMSSGSALSGPALWVNSGPVISQVVVSTPQADTNFEAQFVELFNPTAAPIVVGSGSTPNQLKLKMISACSIPGTPTCTGSTYGIKLNYVNTTIPAYGYYLIANIATFTVNGIRYTADAVYADDANNYCSIAPLAAFWNTGSSPPRKKMAPDGHSATFFITSSSDVILDAFGWDHNGTVSANCETNCLQTSAGGPVGEQFVRLVSTATSVADHSTYGRAYDSGNNRVDFSSTTGGFIYPVFTSTAPTRTVLAGKTAVGAVVSATDGLSLSTYAYSTGSPPVARFSLTQIATGTWSLLVSTGGYLMQYDTMTIAASGSVFTLPSTWTFLNTTNSDAFIEGSVTNVMGVAISPAIPIDPTGSGAVRYANTTNGRYLLRVTPGLVDVIANSGTGAASSYISLSSIGVTAVLGAVTPRVDFALPQGGRLSGFVTRDGVNALPGISLSVVDINGLSRDTPVSGSDGRFTSLNISTGQYVVTPALDDMETVSPTSATVSVTAGGNTYSSTFTVSGALGKITGAVTVSGAPLRTGALIVVTTATLSGTPPAPPALSSTTLTGSPYYISSSQEDGTFTVEVRQSTSPAYRVYAYYTTVSASGATINSLSQTNVQVLAGQTTSGVNFAW